MDSITIEQCRIQIREQPTETWRVYIPQSERDYHGLDYEETYSFSIDGESWKRSINEDGRVTIPKEVRNRDDFPDLEHLQDVELTIEE